MKILDHTKRYVQITDTVAYTEVLYSVSEDAYQVVWHDIIIFDTDDRQAAIEFFAKRIGRKVS